MDRIGHRVNASPLGNDGVGAHVTQRNASRTLAFGPTAIALTSNDLDAADWLCEFLEPWFTPTFQTADWHVRCSSSLEAYAELSARRSPDAAPHPCFALDQQMLCLPAWIVGSEVTVADAERSCFFTVRPFEVDIVSDPQTRRWRFTLMWVFREIVATRLRHTQLEVHAAAIEAAGRAILISGPKRAGKTTLCIHLLRSGACRLIANDRVFVGGAGTFFAVGGVPTAVKIRAAVASQFPELGRGLSRIARPYLKTFDELAHAIGIEESPEPTELALSTAQLARQLRVEPLGGAPLGAIVFPEIRADLEGWVVERLTPADVSARIWANLFANWSDLRAPTLFEDLDGGLSLPSRSFATALADVVPGYRLLLGRRAYDKPEGAARLLEMLGAS